MFLIILHITRFYFFASQPLQLINWIVVVTTGVGNHRSHQFVVPRLPKRHVGTINVILQTSSLNCTTVNSSAATRTEVQNEYERGFCLIE